MLQTETTALEHVHKLQLLKITFRSIVGLLLQAFGRVAVGDGRLPESTQTHTYSSWVADTLTWKKDETSESYQFFEHGIVFSCRADCGPQAVFTVDAVATVTNYNTYTTPAQALGCSWDTYWNIGFRAMEHSYRH